MVDHIEVRRGAYHDSVSLMAASSAVAAMDGVEASIVAMATELNREVVASHGFALPAGAGPNDLLIALRAADEEGMAQARAAAEEALASLAGQRGGAVAQGRESPPRTVSSAARGTGNNLAVVSVPGPHAFLEAMDALEAGLNVMVFSDNVSVEEEVKLKERAADRGLLVMGPDCGTAIIGGVALGFANVTRPGPVGIVGASGTGIQQICCLLDDAGAGISHALGTGGRDLSADVAARSTLAALEALDAHPGTTVIAVVSKPPASEVASRVREAAESCATPVVLGFVGRGERDLTAVADEILERLGLPAGRPASWPGTPVKPDGHALRGLFSGGTLCEEAMVIASDALGPIASNIPLEAAWELEQGIAAVLSGAELVAAGDATRHAMIDFGDDEFTRGRPHPMIDQSLRIAGLQAAASDPSVGVVLLDVVLGHGAHPDPAAELAPAIASARRDAAARGSQLAVVVSLCGTLADPQDRSRQAGALVRGGAAVYLSNAEAARAATALVKGIS